MTIVDSEGAVARRSVLQKMDRAVSPEVLNRLAMVEARDYLGELAQAWEEVASLERELAELEWKMEEAEERERYELERLRDREVDLEAEVRALKGEVQGLNALLKEYESDAA